MKGAPVATGPRLAARAGAAADGRSAQPAGYAGMTCAGSPPCETVGERGQVRVGQGQGEVRAGQGMAGYGRACQDRERRVRSGQDRTGQDRTGQGMIGRAGKGGEGQVRKLKMLERGLTSTRNSSKAKQT